MQITIDRESAKGKKPDAINICPTCQAITLWVYLGDRQIEIKIDYFDTDSSLVRIYYDRMLRAVCYSLDENGYVDVLVDECHEPDVLKHCLEVVKNYIWEHI